MTKDDSQDKPVTQIPDDELQYGSEISPLPDGQGVQCYLGPGTITIWLDDQWLPVPNEPELENPQDVDADNADAEQDQ